MKVKYFPDTDTALVEFTDKEVYKTKGSCLAKQRGHVLKLE
jgi:uncharacterized protein YuzE